MKLTSSQKAAVEHLGNLSLVSCPGSGKTRTLISKLLDILPETTRTTRLACCITYTNAAVQEIEVRLRNLGISSNGDYEVDTIHTFCLKHILRPFSWKLEPFPSGFTLVSSDDPTFQTIAQKIIKRHNLNGRAVEDFGNLLRGTGIFPDSITDIAAKEFWKELDTRSMIDLNGIIYWSSLLVSTHSHIARGLASRYKFLVIDEFQDTTKMQVDILRAIHKFDRTIFFFVGDPHQSIMSGFGARPELMNTFAREVNARVDVQLFENFRSSRSILSLADQICPREKAMVPAGEASDVIDHPQWFTVLSMEDGILEHFLPIIKKHHIPLSEVAILANRWTSLIPVARAMRQHQVPIIGPGSRPYKRSGLLARLLEEVGARVSEKSINGLGPVRRELQALLNTINSHPPTPEFSFDVAIIKALIGARTIAQSESIATKFIPAFVEHLSNVLISSDLISPFSVPILQSACTQMVTEINKYEVDHNTRVTTIGDLGMFARGSNSIRLLTMHGSKGREFDAVAIIDFFDGHVPFYKAKIGDEIEAEGRRLFYVAATRARKVLQIFTLQSPTYKTQPSRFLKDVFPKGPDSF